MRRFCQVSGGELRLPGTGNSISKEQISYARNFCRGLPVKILNMDYRNLKGSFDKLLICGMIEHVGYRNYRAIMNKVREVLRERGLFLLHTIGSKISHKYTNPWISKYIFPNSMTPSISQLSKSAEGLFVIEDLHNFGVHYVQTLFSWHDRFLRNWHSIEDHYDDRFFRMWEYYLLSKAGFFASRAGQLWQIVLSPAGMPAGHRSIRYPVKVMEVGR